jgi:hypothetical protein
MFPVVSTRRTHQINGTCMAIHGFHSNIIVLSTFITDSILLGLMFVGVLRWPNSRMRGRTWWLLYTQASLHHLVDNGWPFNLIPHAN